MSQTKSWQPFVIKAAGIRSVLNFYSAAALLAMQSAVIPTVIPSVRPSVRLSREALKYLGFPFNISATAALSS